jgi:hypothetical protein
MSDLGVPGTIRLSGLGANASLKRGLSQRAEQVHAGSEEGKRLARRNWNTGDIEGIQVLLWRHGAPKGEREAVAGVPGHIFRGSREVAATAKRISERRHRLAEPRLEEASGLDEFFHLVGLGEASEVGVRASV